MYLLSAILISYFKMSAINNSDVHINAAPAAPTAHAVPTAPAVSALKAKSVRKPKLPAKMDKLLLFGFWFSQRLFDNGLIPNDLDSKNKVFQTLSMFDSLDAQTALFDSFESQSNATKKAMRLIITAFHKPPKISKSTKSKPNTTNPTNPETKRGRKKNSLLVVVDNHDELISQLVRVANEGDSSSGEPRFPRTPPPFTEGGAELEAEPLTEPVTLLVTSTETVVAAKANSKSKSKEPKEPKEPKAKVTKTKAVKEVAVEPVAPVVVEQPVVMVEPVAPVVGETQPKKKAAAKKAVKEVVVAPVVEPVVPAAVEPVVESVVAPVAVETPVVVETQPKKKAAKKAPTSEEKSEAKSEEKPKSKSKAKSSLPVTVPEPSLPTPSIPSSSSSSSSSDEGGGLGGNPGSPLDMGPPLDLEEAVHAREFIFQGKTFLIDSDNNDIYDFDTQDLLGNFDPILNSIRFI